MLRKKYVVAGVFTAVILTGCGEEKQEISPNEPEVLTEVEAFLPEELQEEAAPEDKPANPEQETSESDPLAIKLVDGISEIDATYIDADASIVMEMSAQGQTADVRMDMNMIATPVWAHIDMFTHYNAGDQAQDLAQEMWINAENSTCYVRNEGEETWSQTTSSFQVDSFTGFNTIKSDGFDNLTLSEEDDIYIVTGTTGYDAISSFYGSTGQDMEIDKVEGLKCSVEYHFDHETKVLQYMRVDIDMSEVDSAELQGATFDEFYVECRYNELSNDKELDIPDFLNN